MTGPRNGEQATPQVAIPASPPAYTSFFWDDEFTDYVMFQATSNGTPNGIWVPEATFSWSIKGPSSLAAGVWSTASLIGKVSSFTLSYNDWPMAYNDLMYVYRGTKVIFG